MHGLKSRAFNNNIYMNIPSRGIFRLRYSIEKDRMSTALNALVAEAK